MPPRIKCINTSPAPEAVRDLHPRRPVTYKSSTLPRYLGPDPPPNGLVFAFPGLFPAQRQMATGYPQGILAPPQGPCATLARLFCRATPPPPLFPFFSSSLSEVSAGQPPPLARP